MKKLLLITAIAVTVAATPVTAMAAEGLKPLDWVAKAGAVLEILNTSKTKYAKEGAAVYEQPNTGSRVLGVSQANTTFEVVFEDQAWSMISTSEGYSFMETANLRDTEIVPYSENDLYVLAHVLAGEAQSLPDEEQRYVGSVVLNRVKHGSFPNTIEGVVFQKGQYACTWDGNYYREPTERNWANARYLLENGSILPDNVIWQSGKRQGKGIYLKTKWHCYCF